MFAAALSGMRAAETADQAPVAAIDYKLVPDAGERKASGRDWRNWVSSDFSSFEDERDCPIFFQKELPGFGTLRATSACTENEED
jgi:hypothetical protein